MDGHLDLNIYQAVKRKGKNMENEKANKLAEDCRILLNGIAGCAKLNYSSDGLRFDDDIIDALFKAIFPEEYKAIFEKFYAEHQKQLESFKAEATE